MTSPSPVAAVAANSFSLITLTAATFGAWATLWAQQLEHLQNAQGAFTPHLPLLDKLAAQKAPALSELVNHSNTAAPKAAHTLLKAAQTHAQGVRHLSTQQGQTLHSHVQKKLEQWEELGKHIGKATRHASQQGCLPLPAFPDFWSQSIKTVRSLAEIGYKLQQAEQQHLQCQLEDVAKTASQSLAELAKPHRGLRHD